MGSDSLSIVRSLLLRQLVTTYLGDHLTGQLGTQKGDLVDGITHVIIVCC